MSSNVDVPYTRGSVSALSQRSNAGGRQRTPRPINESMVRERLSANLPNSFHYLNSTLPMGSRRHRHRHHRHRDSSNGSSRSSSSSDGESGDDANDDAGHMNEDGLDASQPLPPSFTVTAGQEGELGASVGSDGRPRRRSATSSRSSSRHPHRRRRRRSGSTSNSTSTDSSEEDENENNSYNFYARLVKLDRSDVNSSGRMQYPFATAAAAAAPPSPAGGAPLVAQCCDTVRDTIDLLDQVRLSPSEDSSDHSSTHNTFFWLDLHGVPPPLPGSPAWGSRSHAWQKRRHAELRRAVQEAAARGTGRQPEVELSALWTALGLQAGSANTLNAVCALRQRAPRPDRTSLDDVYEEEMVDLAFPDDRILHVDAMATGGAAGTEPIHQHHHRYHPTSREEQPPSPKGGATRVVQGQPLTAQTSFVAASGSATHYLMMELSTLLTSVPAATTHNGVGAWSTTFLANLGTHEYANEPLNDQIWAETLGRSMHTFPSHYRAAAAAQRRTRGGGSRQLTLASLSQPELPATPLITSTYVICFPGGCVTWCPGSTLGLISAARREKRAALAQQRKQKQQQQRRKRRSRSAARRRGGSSLRTTADAPDAAQRLRVAEQRSDDDASSACTDTDDSDVDEGLAVQYVKSWEQLQASVFHRLRHMSSSVGNQHHEAGDHSGGAPPLCTSGFVSLLLSAVCYAYLPNTTSVLSEVDAIDSMLPLVGLNVESDQADALRRVLLLRRRLAVHRRLLFQKIRLLEALDKPAMHTIARFVRTVKAPSWMERASARASARGGGSSGSPRAIGTHSSEGQRRDSDTDSLSAAPTPHQLDRTATAPHFSGAGAQPIVHFLDTAEEPPWSYTTAEQNYGGRGVMGGSGNVSSTYLTGAEGERRTGSRTAANSGCPVARMAEPPSLNAIHKGIANTLRSLEVARTVLGNTTLIYCSTVNFSNSRTSELSDYFALICQYVLLIVLPLNIVASHWGMNCAVPFMEVEGTKPFWSIVGVMIFFAIAGLAVPIYAYRTRQINMIS